MNVYLFIFLFRCIFAAPYLGCLKGDEKLAILFLVNLFIDNSQHQSVTINNIFGAGAQGPFHLESVTDSESILAIRAEGDNRKRVLILSETPITIPRDISGDAPLYVTTADDEKILFDTTYKNGVRNSL